MTTSEMAAPMELLPDPEQIHIHVPSEALLQALAGMAAPVLPVVRQRLATEAVGVHDRELAMAVETGRTGEVPGSVAIPGIVGAETVALLGAMRKRAGRKLVQHPTDATKRLIVPL